MYISTKKCFEKKPVKKKRPDKEQRPEASRVIKMG